MKKLMTMLVAVVLVSMLATVSEAACRAGLFAGRQARIAARQGGASACSNGSCAVQAPMKLQRSLEESPKQAPSAQAPSK